MFPRDLCQASDQIQMTGSPPMVVQRQLVTQRDHLERNNADGLMRGGGGIYIGVDAPNA